MKKFLVIFMVLTMCLALCACAMTNEDGTPTVAGVAIEEGMNLLFRLFGIGVMAVFTWAGAKLGDNKKLQSIGIALNMLKNATMETVGEFQQTFVTELKEKRGGKLTDDDIKMIQKKLLSTVQKKLSKPAQDLITAAGSDIDALIVGAAEDWLNTLKNTAPIVAYDTDG